MCFFAFPEKARLVVFGGGANFRTKPFSYADANRRKYYYIISRVETINTPGISLGFAKKKKEKRPDRVKDRAALKLVEPRGIEPLTS